MSVEIGMVGWWNSNSRFNKSAKVIGANGDNYAIEADGHVYIVPKRNISLEKKVFEGPETTAPRPELDYWFTLKADEWRQIRDAVAHDGPWRQIIMRLAHQAHSGQYTNEWFSISADEAWDLLVRYRYPSLRYEKDTSRYLPGGPHYATVVAQVWAEALRRDGITLQ